MDKKVKYLLVIGFFPVIIFYSVLKFSFGKIKNKLICKYIGCFDMGKIDMLDGHSFEDFLYYYFLSLGLKVKKTPKSRDYGADLVLTHKKEKIVVQCKNYYNHNVGNSAIQEIATAKNYYNAEMGIVVTNWFFTAPAQTLANKVGVKLVDREMLQQLLIEKPKKAIRLLIV